MNATLETVTTFVLDNNYHNTEQMRPYLSDFMALKTEMERNNEYPYNNSFKGKIPGLSTSPHEDTGIYLLQKLADLESLRARTQAFLDAGGYRFIERLPNATERGTLVLTGFYMGGTGWSENHHAIVKVDETGRVLFKLPRQKNWRYHLSSLSSYLFMPDSPS